MGGGNFANTKLAIVVPVYNTERYLAECLDSIRSQDYSNYVVFIVDDGSTDNSLSIANRFARESLNCIVMHKENGGVSSARNVALDMIEEDGSFDVVCFLDSDDVAAANSFNTIANAFSKYQADYICAGYVGFDKKGLIKGRKRKSHAPIVLESDAIFKFLFGADEYADRSYPAISVILGNYYFSTRIIGKIRFDEEKTTCEDQDFRFRVLLNARRGVAISDCTLHYRSRGSSLSHTGFCCTDDVKMLNSWLDIYSEIPNHVKNSLEEYALASWWSSLRRAGEFNHILDSWDAFASCLNRMRKEFKTNAIKKNSVRKRIFIFSLGRRFLTLYFKLKKGYIKKKFDNAFE